MRPDARDRLLADTFSRFCRATGQEREALGRQLDELLANWGAR